MLLGAQLLTEPDVDSDRVLRTAEAIQRGVKTLVQLIDDLLDVSRIVTGKLKMELHAVDLRAIVNAAVVNLALPAEKKMIALDVTTDTAAGMVAGDAARLQQVVSNLLTNAIKFTPQRGKVSVGLTYVNGSAELKVADTGVGIAPEFLPHVFGRFSQADSSNTRRTGGLGLGLAIARHILELHGGHIRAESDGVGHGATFFVSLPLIAELREKDEGSEARPLAIFPSRPLQRRAGATLRNVRILLVDDDPATHEIVSGMLRMRGARVGVAATTVEAMAMLTGFDPTVIISDIAMPGEDGYAFIRKVRALGGSVPALALTALAGEEDRQRALAAGFQLHCAKPIDIDHLAEVVLELADMNQAFRLQRDRVTARPN